MKKSILTILLAFVMLFNVSSQNTTKVDSINKITTVEVKFENPQLDVSISDQRDKDYIDIFTQVLNESLLTNDLLEESLATTNKHLSKYLRVHERKEGMSSMDYLRQKTGMSNQEIKNALNQYHKITSVTYFILLLMVIGMYMSYIVEHNKYERDWRHSIGKTIGIVMLLYFSYDIIHSWLLYLFAKNYIHFEHLIQLTT